MLKDSKVSELKYRSEVEGLEKSLKSLKESAFPLFHTKEHLKIYDSESWPVQFDKIHQNNENLKCHYIIIIKSGEGTYINGKYKYSLRHKSIFLTDSVQIVPLNPDSNLQVNTIAFTHLFMIRSGEVDIYNIFPFLLSRINPSFRFHSESFEEYLEIFDTIKEEYGSDFPRRANIIAALITRILLKLKLKNECYSVLSWPENSQQQIVYQFIQDLNATTEELLNVGTTQLRVKDFAKLQQLHESYFKQIIKTRTGKSAREWIQEKLLGAAISLLESRQLSIKEISFKLGFSHVSNFSSFIKKRTGYPPSYY